MTYDSVELINQFHSKESLGYALLRDANGQHAEALGIRNEAYEKGHAMFGIPHPGVMFVDTSGTIRAKYAVPGYRQRPPFDALLQHISGLLAE